MIHEQSHTEVCDSSTPQQHPHDCVGRDSRLSKRESAMSHDCGDTVNCLRGPRPGWITIFHYMIVVAVHTKHEHGGMKIASPSTARRTHRTAINRKIDSIVF